MSLPTRAPSNRPPAWRLRSVPRRWRYRLAPDPLKRAPKGLVSLRTRARRLLWSSWPWALGCLWAAQSDRWGWAAGLAMLALFTFLATPTEFPPRYGLDHEFTIESHEFLSTIAGATGIPFAGGNRLDILNNGDAFYPAMLEEIARARASITIEAYIYWAGEVGLQFAQALADRAKADVRVKILLDAVGSARVGEEILKTLESGGCQLAWYNPIRWNALGGFNHRTHRKSLIVDGRVGFTGGAGIADHWRGNAQDADHWRDIQIRIEGPAVAPLQTGFAHNWLECTGELVSGELYYPLRPHTPGRLAVQTIMSSPETGASTARIMYCLSIICARHSIHIANPYFVPDQVAIDTLVEARQRGVDVKIMVAGRRNDSQLARHNSVRLYGPMLEAGVEILEYTKTMLHHKTMLVDERWGTVGTTNFDNRSFAHNEETNVCFYDRALAHELHETFLADARECERISLEAWRRRGAWTKSVELAASFFRDQV